MEAPGVNGAAANESRGHRRRRGRNGSCSRSRRGKTKTIENDSETETGRLAQLTIEKNNEADAKEKQRQNVGTP